MNLMLIENDKPVYYNVNYDSQKMNTFLDQVVIQYGHVRPEKIALNKVKHLKSFCDEYMNLKIVSPYFKNEELYDHHKRLKRDIPIVHAWAEAVLIDYPEIYFTMMRFLKNKTIDFNVFNKYIKADEDVNYEKIDDYIVEGKMGYNLESYRVLKVIADDDVMLRQYINEIVRKRVEQRSCLKYFYELLIKNKVEDVDYYEQELLLMKSMPLQRNFSPGMNNIDYLINPIYLQPFNVKMMSYIKAMNLAESNTKMLEKIKQSNIADPVKELK